ncbi:hypothetical protein CC80DRAFT_517486 [Byssothecium circinans]|uniref:Uncharacterized protein n=1 Tax=Byssothecium circinans TaxID=147558 RepID=A0A6A5TS59_9PLEO|nr:hypothetical protein CC80DRAFT_517486 [Byssothecium circinans]
MDTEDILAICFMGSLLLLPLAAGLAATAIVAYSRTKKWDTERNLKASNLESSSSLLPHDDDESDFLDTDDEAKHNERKAEEEADRFLTFHQMWRKEFRKVWSGKGAKNMAKEREREERKKLAKAVAKELERRDRRRARKERAAMEGEGLPPYKK